MKYNAVTRRVKRDDVIDIQVYNSCDYVAQERILYKKTCILSQAHRHINFYKISIRTYFNI